MTGEHFTLFTVNADTLYSVRKCYEGIFFCFCFLLKVSLLTVCPNCCHCPGPHSRHERLCPEQGAADLAPHCQREGQC